MIPQLKPTRSPGLGSMPLNILLVLLGRLICRWWEVNSMFLAHGCTLLGIPQSGACVELPSLHHHRPTRHSCYMSSGRCARVRDMTHGYMRAE